MSREARRGGVEDHQAERWKRYGVALYGRHPWHQEATVGAGQIQQCAAIGGRVIDAHALSLSQKRGQDRKGQKEDARHALHVGAAKLLSKATDGKLTFVSMRHRARLIVPAEDTNEAFRESSSCCSAQRYDPVQENRAVIFRSS